MQNQNQNIKSTKQNKKAKKREEEKKYNEKNESMKKMTTSEEIINSDEKELINSMGKCEDYILQEIKESFDHIRKKMSVYGDDSNQESRFSKLHPNGKSKAEQLVELMTLAASSMDEYDTSEIGYLKSIQDRIAMNKRFIDITEKLK
jgi:hypothetical protein